MTTDKTRISPLLLHVFTHGGVSYEVRVRHVDGEAFAALHMGTTDHQRPLLPFPADIPARTSTSSIRAGYIGVAEWLVKTGRWPDAETKSLFAAEGLQALAA